MKSRDLYYFVYYRCYDLLRITGNYDLAFGASHFLSLFQAALVSILLTLIIQGSDLPLSFTVTLFVLVFLTFEFVNYFIFVKNGFYAEVVERFESENKIRKYSWRVVVLTATAILVYQLF
jgi:hypothetical protein